MSDLLALCPLPEAEVLSLPTTRHDWDGASTVVWEGMTQSKSEQGMRLSWESLMRESEVEDVQGAGVLLPPQASEQPATSRNDNKSNLPKIGLNL